MRTAPPNSIIKDLYLEITNISQGVNVAIFVYVVTTRDFFSSISDNYYSTPLIAVASLLIVVIFWTRYYLDTAILERSFTVLSVTWFFLYIVVQGVSISFITEPWAWFLCTGVFLLFGGGFYGLNLRELERKQRSGALPDDPRYVRWQARRMVELIVLAFMSLAGALLIKTYPALAPLGGISALMFALWQAVITGDYRRLGFIETGT